MDLRDPDALNRMRRRFAEAGFVQDLGMTLDGIGPGWTETSLTVAPRHFQADRFVHAGVQATMGDHSAGIAAGTLTTADEAILTVEFKINLLRPAVGERLFCRADVLRAGRTLTVAESRVYAEQDGERRQTALLVVTLAVVSPRNERT